MAYTAYSTALLSQDKTLLIEAKSFKYWAVAPLDFDESDTWAIFGHFSKRDSLTVATFDTEALALSVLAELLHFVRNYEIADWTWPDFEGRRPSA